MLVNYPNLGDPFVVILALPATLCGIVTMLFITGTSLSVPSLMGAIMAVGVASANSILLVTFAREQQLAGRTAFQAAIDAGHTRIRPVLMTAAAKPLRVTEAFPWSSALACLVRDRDGPYGHGFRSRVRAMSIRDRPISSRSPWQNGYSERPVRSRGLS
jgi:hypothetical protein